MESVAERPWPQGTTVRVVMAVKDVIPFATAFWYGPKGSLEHAQHQITERGEQVCARAVELLRLRGIKTEMVVREGDPRTLILTEAKGWPADLIVIGSHGHTRAEKELLGAVAEAVIAHASCSVEVVREQSAKGNVMKSKMLGMK